MPAKYTPEQALAAFWNKVDKSPHPTGCWNWIAQRDRQGYGRLTWNGRNATLAHRVAYLLAYGEYPPNLKVLHSCDNPACVNPDHLSLGTQANNVDDMENKKRSVHVNGERSGMCRLTDDQVDMIRAEYSTGRYTTRELAAQYNVSHGQVGRIARGQSRVSPTSKTG